MKPSGQILTALADATVLKALTASATSAERVATSPDGRTQIRLSNESGQANFTIKFNGDTLDAPVSPGLALDRGGSLSRILKLVWTGRQEVDETCERAADKARSVQDPHAGTTVEFLEANGMRRSLKVAARRSEGRVTDPGGGRTRFDVTPRRTKAGFLDMRS